MSEWKTIDSAPKDGTRIIGGSTGGRVEVVAHAQGNWRGDPWREGHHLGRIAWIQPTHWMPLPEPPIPFAGRPTGDET